MKRLVTTVLLALVLALAIVSLALYAVAATGAVDVAATADYVPGAEWFFSTLSDRSVERRAAEAVEAGEITPPAEISREMLDNGASHYGPMCVACHGAPGVSRGEIGEGLKPKPPELSHTAREMSREEIFWVIQNGIRHSGMPAFGATHSADDLWALTGFVERLGDMSPEEYETWTGGSGGGEGGHGHGDSEEEGHAHGGDEGGEDGDGHEGHDH